MGISTRSNPLSVPRRAPLYEYGVTSGAEVSIVSVFLIAYDLNREVTRPPIVKKIKDIGDGWARLSESSYAVSYGGTSSQIFNTLKPMIDENDNLYVITLKKPWDGYGPKDVVEWLNSNLPA